MKKHLTLILMASLLCACGGYTNPPIGYNDGNGGTTIIGGGTGVATFAPIASFSVSSVSGRTVKLRDSSKGLIMEYHFGDGTEEAYFPESGYITLSSTERYITHTYSKKGTYTITLYVYSNDGTGVPDVHAEKVTIN